MGLESSLICGPQCGLTEEVRSRRADSNGFVPRAGHLPFSLDQAETSLGARFSDIALRYPTRSAVVLADETELSYSDLLQRSMRIAGGLLASLAERTGPLAILLPPSLDGIEAILGALLAGFAYLPIDPSIPDTQLDRLLAAARPVALF